MKLCLQCGRAIRGDQEPLYQTPSGPVFLHARCEDAYNRADPTYRSETIEPELNEHDDPNNPEHD